MTVHQFFCVLLISFILKHVLGNLFDGLVREVTVKQNGIGLNI